MVHKILKFLIGPSEEVILYKSNGHMRTKGYTNVDWPGSKLDKRSATGYWMMVGENFVAWKSKKKVVA